MPIFQIIITIFAFDSKYGMLLKQVLWLIFRIIEDLNQ